MGSDFFACWLKPVAAAAAGVLVEKAKRQTSGGLEMRYDGRARQTCSEFGCKCHVLRISNVANRTTFLLQRKPDAGLSYSAGCSGWAESS